MAGESFFGSRVISPFEVLATTANRLAESDGASFSDTVNTVLRNTAYAIAADALSLHSFVEETREIVPVGMVALNGSVHTVPRWHEVPVLLVKLARFEPAVVDDITGLGQEWQAERRWLEGQDAKSFCAYPIVIEQRCVGMLLATGRNRLEWSDDALALVRAVGEVVLVASRRFHAERRLKRLQDRATTLVESLPVSVVLTDKNAKISWANVHARGFFMGNQAIPRWQDICHPDDLAQVLDEMVNAIESQRTIAVECRLLNVQNEYRWMSLRGEPRREDGVFVGHAVSAIDITERLQATEAAAERARFSQVVLELSRRFVDIDAEEVGEAIDDALTRVGEFLELDRGILGLLDRSPDATLEFRYVSDWSPDGLPSADGTDRIGVAELPHIFSELRGLRAVSIDRLDELPQTWVEERRSAQRRGIRSMLWVPVSVRGRLGGVLWLSVTHEERSWSESLAVVRILADVFGGALERLRADDELLQAAYNDRLTGALNRAGTLDEVSRGLAEDGPLGLTTALMFLDLDGFKGVNDTYGHDAGDEVLVQVADRLRALIRPSDSLGRLGGDEFVLLCRNVGDLRTATAIGNRVVKNLSAEMELSSATVKIGASVGIALIKGAQWTVEETIRLADEAMYKAKKAGKGQISINDRREDQQALKP